MKSAITIGANISKLRKDAHLTQDDLATYLGVTKASVSKWETGQSYPDIELLPRIATYFNTTVDALIGYEPQLDKASIRRECARLRTAFATEPFEQAHAQCQELVRDYYSCYPLLAQIAALYLNHMNLVEGPERGALADEAVELCRRIKRNSESSADIKQAEGTEACILLAMGNPQAAADMLEQTAEPDPGLDILLANAYGALGRADDADSALQGALFQGIILSLNRLSQMALLHATDPGKLDAIHERARALIDAFALEGLFLNTPAMHLSFAAAYLMSGNVPSALDCLDDYERSCRALKFPLALHGDDFFDKIEAYAEEFNVAGTDMPRDEALVKKSMVDGVAANPLFAPLAGDARFKRVVASLEEIART